MADLTRHVPHGDAAALAASPSLGEVAAYRRLAGVGWYRSVAVVTVGLVVAVAALAAGVVAAQPLLEGAPDIAKVAFGAAPLAWASLLIGGYAWWLTWRLRDVRLWRFARSGGLGFADRLESGGDTWRTARVGTGFPSAMRNIERGVLSDDGVVTLGRNQSVAPQGSERVHVRRPFGFAEVVLPAAVPQIILKNRRSRILSLLGAGIGNRRTLSLEGDFDRHFTLLCPEGYERDALQIFTPDVMAAVIDVAGGAEVELVEDRLYLYFPHATPLWRVETMTRLQQALALLQAKFHRQTRGYRDDRAVLADHGGIALAGRRTTDRNGAPAAGVAAVVAVAVLSAVVTVLSLFVVPNL